MSLIVPGLWLLGSAVAIYLACEYFVNGIEWVGRLLSVGPRATGSVLAALGTALPETAVTFIAVVFGPDAAHKAIGIGAALGGPLVLATLGYGIVGVVLLISRGRRSGGDGGGNWRELARDQGLFVPIFVVVLLLGILSFPGKGWLGVLLLLAYALYFRSELRTSGDEAHADGEPEPLRLSPRGRPRGWVAGAQTLAALALIFIASRLFVHELGVLAPQLGVPPPLLALLLSPVATELPETLNAVIWVRQGRARLALANISGSMMIQATVPAALGLLFTPWRLDRPLLLAGAITLAAVTLLYAAFRAGRVGPVLLSAMAGFYALFVGLLVLT
jgi:Ca2+/Na+ antiporter